MLESCPPHTEAWPGVDLPTLREYAAEHPWAWPNETFFVLQDLHADVDGFTRSLRACGVTDDSGALTAPGRAGLVVIGGDVFDKGDSTLGLLEAIESLRSAGARVEVLAGNHDLRNRIGLAFLGARELETAHLFLRCFPKGLALLADVHRRELAGGDAPRLSEEAARAAILPGEEWFEAWPRAVAGTIPAGRIEKELARLVEKQEELDAGLTALGMSYAALHQAAERTRELLAAGGRWGWYFEEMTACRRAGSFVILHAGIGDEPARLLAAEGPDGLNATFRDLLDHDPYTLYHGPVASLFRTKYRPGVDLPLTDSGTAALRSAGVHVLVHGHAAEPGGPRLELHAGLLHAAAHALVDKNSRSLFGLSGSGAAAVVLEPDRLVGYHADRPPRVLTRAELEGSA